jgi:plastocyanin
MDTLDSRALRYTDCFVQKFSEPDTVFYWITSPSGKLLPIEREQAFVLRVKAGPRDGAEGQQHDITVKYDGRNFVADPPELEITAGDFVLWNTPDASTPGFIVIGEGENARFDSSALAAEAIYTHAFSIPGEYQWVDANGGPARGRVRVIAPEPTRMEDLKKLPNRFLEALEEPIVILVRDDEASPTEVQAMVGQTVFWTVERSSGMAVTDARLVTEHIQGGPK